MKTAARGRGAGRRAHTLAAALALLLLLPVAGNCITWNKGLKPIQPSYWPLRSGTSVDTLSPVFQWEPYEGDLPGLTNLRYELQIAWKSSVVYRTVTRETVHSVSKTLLPGQTYAWYVRPLFTVDGQNLAGDWNRQGYFYITPLIVFFGWGERNYQFTTPD